MESSSFRFPRAVLISLAFVIALSTPASAQVLFTPGDDVEAAVTAAIRGAQKQVLVQAFSFTSRPIARHRSNDCCWRLPSSIVCLFTSGSME